MMSNEATPLFQHFINVARQCDVARAPRPVMHMTRQGLLDLQLALDREMPGFTRSWPIENYGRAFMFCGIRFEPSQRAVV